MKRKISTNYMAKIGLLAVLGLISELFNFPLPLLPPFLKFDLSSLPSVIGGVALGPMAAVFTELVKNLLKFVMNSQTVGIGELSNFICGVALSVPVALVFKKSPDPKGFFLGSVLGVISLSAAACLSNYFIIIPAYAVAFGGLDKIIALCAKVNSSITDLKAVIFLGVLPFNLIKGIATVAIGGLIYDRILKGRLAR